MCCAEIPSCKYEAMSDMSDWRTEFVGWTEAMFDRSAGPGGQNVNKLNTRVTLLLDFEACPAFSEFQRGRIRARLQNRLASDGRLRVVAQSERSQSANRAAAQERMLKLLEQSLHVERARRPTKPTAGSRRRRLDAKRKRGELKRQRKPDS